MGWRFRTSFSPIPGVRLTLSPSGFTTSVGAGPVRLSMGPRGAAITATVPGTELSYRHRLSTTPARRSRNPPEFDRRPIPQAPLLEQPRVKYPPSVPPASAGLQPIQSSGTRELTSEGLNAFKEALGRAQRQFTEVQRDRDRAAAEEVAVLARYRSWMDGWLLKRLMKARFARMKAAADEASDLREELDLQLDLSKLRTQFEMPDRVKQSFARLNDDFVVLSRSQRIWDNVAHKATDRVRERTLAGRSIDRKPVGFSLGCCGVIETKSAVPRLQNANGGDIYLYPGFVVYMISESTYALIEYGELDMLISRTRFHEEDAVPTDAEQVAVTWAKCNKDGTPDRRFNANYQIPVMQYAIVMLRTARGLNEEYLISNVAASEAFLGSWQAHVAAIREGR